MLTITTNTFRIKDSEGNMEDIGAIVGYPLTDISLTQSNMPADSKIVGDELEKINTKLDDYYLKTEADNLHKEIKEYVDTEVAALVNSAPETLDTLGELAAAFNENADMIATLDAAITNKADKAAVEALQEQILPTSLILADAITGVSYTIQIQNGQLVSFETT